jgi:hypothetical protein
MPEVSLDVIAERCQSIRRLGTLHAARLRSFNLVCPQSESSDGRDKVPQAPL